MTITQLIGADKEREDDEAKRLGSAPQPQLLPAPETMSPTTMAGNLTVVQDDLDDEIPI